MNTNSLIKRLSINGHGEFQPTPNQEKILSAIDTHNRVIVHHTRRAGITTCLTLNAIASSLLNPGQCIGVLSMKPWHMLDAIRDVVRGDSALASQLVHHSGSQISFTNGSHIFAFDSINAMRGISLRSLLLDNFNYYSAPTQERMIASVYPCLLRGAKIVITANGDIAEDSWLHEKVEQSRRSEDPHEALIEKLKGRETPFQLVEIKTSDLYNQPVNWIEKNKQVIGKEHFEQEYMLSWPTQI
jgi:hypothetical protein